MTVRSHEDLEVYQIAYRAAQRIFVLSRKFPREETYSLTDQILRSSRSVYANLAEGWRKRRYEGAFCLKLTDAEGEAAETQSWIRTAADCGYISREVENEMFAIYDHIIGKLVNMYNNPNPWLLTK
jgi:four helix bundle protein